MSALGARPHTGPLPRISIVTPSYNQGRFLRRCIDSVLDQGWPDLEYFVLDGGSTDESCRILESYGDRVRWRSRRDGGQSAAINEGFAQATGDIVAWLNSDDYYLPGAFLQVVRALEVAPGACGVHGAGWMVGANEKILRAYPTGAVAREDLEAKCRICQPTVFLRRETLQRHGGLNESLALCLDYEWWLRITRHDHLAFCNVPLAATRQYPGTKTVSRRSRALVEAGYVLQHHFGSASWHWSVKWAVHRFRLGRGNVVRRATAAARTGLRYRGRFSATSTRSKFGASFSEMLAAHDGSLDRGAARRERRALI